MPYVFSNTVPQGSIGSLLSKTPTKTQTSTPIGNVQVPSSNPLQAAYGGTTSIPIGSKPLATPAPVTTTTSNSSQTIPSVSTNTQTQPGSTQYNYLTGKALAPGESQPTYNTQTGQKIGDSTSTPQINPTPTAPATQPATQNQTQGQSTTPATNTLPGLQGSLLSQAMNYLTQAGNVASQKGQLQEAINENVNNVTHNPNYSLDTGIGRAGQIQQSFGNQLTGLANQEGALAQLGNAAITGASAASPANTLYQVSPGTTAYNASNQPVVSGLGGLVGYNIALQNIKQGSGYQQQATDLSTTLDQLKNTGNQVTNLMGLTGANWSNLPIANQAIKQYMANANPSAQQSINAGLGEVKNYVSSILAASTGLTPTEVSQVVNEYPFENLSPNQLTDFLKNVDSYGQTRLQALQGSEQSSYSAGNTPYAGSTASPQALVPGQANPTGEAVAGTAATAGQTLLNDIVNKASGLVSGAVGGAAAKMFGI